MKQTIALSEVWPGHVSSHELCNSTDRKKPKAFKRAETSLTGRYFSPTFVFPFSRGKKEVMEIGK